MRKKNIDKTTTIIKPTITQGCNTLNRGRSLMAETEGYRISYFITSNIKVKDMNILTQSNIVQRSFATAKEGQKFIDDLVKFTEKQNSFLHYNFEEIQAVLLESRGKITRDNKIKSEKQNDEAVS